MRGSVRPWEIMPALMQRGQNAQAEGGTLSRYVEAVTHPLDKVRSREDLVAVIAYLTAQLVGARARLDADELTALLRVEEIIKDWREREKRALEATSSVDAMAVRHD